MYQEQLPHSENVIYLGKIVGTFTSDRIFVSHRRQEHIFRKFRGLGISYGLLRDLMNRNCVLIRFILDKGDNTQEVYSALPITFLTEGHIWIDKQQDTQRILPFDRMMCKTKLENY
jgi:hypothetical protein